MTLIGIELGFDGPDVWMFQSLFSWMTLIGAIVPTVVPLTIDSFNPCFLG